MSHNPIQTGFTTKNDAIALEIFNRLKKIEPNLEAKGMIAGQSVATIYQDIIGSNLKGQVNDIDQFFFVSIDSKMYRDYLNTENVSEFKKVATNFPSVIGIGSEIQDHHDYGRVVFIDRKKGSYRVFCTARNRLINSVVGVVEKEVKFTKNPLSELELLVSGFDLNAVMAGICFDTAGNPKLFLHPDYLKFLQTGEILVANFFSYAHSVLRGHKKKSQIENSFFNTKGYVDSFYDKEFISSFYAETIIDSYLSERFSEELSEIGLFNFGEINESCKGCVHERSSLEKKILLQERMGISYGFKKSLLSLIKQGLESGFILGESPDWSVAKNRNSIKSLKAKHKFIYNHISLLSLDGGLKMLDTIYLFKKEEVVIGRIESLISMAKRDGDYASLNKLEFAVKSKDRDFVLSTIESIEKAYLAKYESNAKAIDSIRSIVARSFFGYKIGMPTTALELSKLGAEEKHCVGGYFSQVVTGRALIFTITKPGQPRTTFEVSDPYKSGAHTVIQHYAKSNSRDFPRSHVYIGLLVSILVTLKKGSLKSLAKIYYDKVKLKIKYRMLLKKNKALSPSLEDEFIPF